VLGPVAALTIVLGLVVSAVPGLATRAHAAADRFRDRPAYVQHVLYAQAQPAAARLPFDVPGASTESLLYGAGASLLGAGFAALTLFRRRVNEALVRPVAPLRALHSGVIGDYVMWLTVGTAVIGGVWAIALH
jgi:multicomponent Na+:H+ antiporter subunit D